MHSNIDLFLQNAIKLIFLARITGGLDERDKIITIQNTIIVTVNLTTHNEHQTRVNTEKN